MKRACTEEQVNIRKEEIINIVSKMFDEMDYQNISMKTISEKISIARSSLYCYYNSKEEIMLDVLKNDYIKFLKTIIENFENKDTIEELTDNITDAYMNNLRVMKIISLYLTDIEIHCSLESLVNFKKDFVTYMLDLKKSICKRFNNIPEKESLIIYNSLLMLTHSLYPLINPVENQKEAMRIVGLGIIEDGREYCKSYLTYIFKNAK